MRLHVDPSIIGGVVVRVGDKLIDGSVTTQLQRLRQRLDVPGVR
jgi:F0F1-type ATP synthase delta subunit